MTTLIMAPPTGEMPDVEVEQKLTRTQCFARLLAAIIDNDLPEPLVIGLTDVSGAWHIGLSNGDRAGVDRWGAFLGKAATSKNYFGNSWWYQVDHATVAWLPGHSIRVYIEICAPEPGPEPTVDLADDSAAIALVRAAADHTAEVSA